MSNLDHSFLFVEPEADRPFVVKKKPNFSDLPNSDTLERMRAFLPLMKHSNEVLEAQLIQNPQSIIVENGDESENSPHIHMDVIAVPDDSEDSDDDKGDQLNSDDDAAEQEEPLPLLFQAMKEANTNSKKVIEEIPNPETEEGDS